MKSSEKIALFLVLGFVAIVGVLLVNLLTDDGSTELSSLMEEPVVEEESEAVVENRIAEEEEEDTFDQPLTVREEIAPTGNRVLDANAGMASGRVVDEKGKPIAEAMVTIFKVGSSILPYLPHLGKLSAEDTTDSEGRYDLINVQKGGPYKIVASHPSFAETYFSPLKVRPGVRHEIPDIVMGQGFSIRGVVTDVSGSPIVGALVQIRDPVRAAFQNREERKPWKQMLTSEAGGYDFQGVAFKTFEVTASAEGFATQKINSNLQFEAKREKVINFQLTPGTFIGGLVLDEMGRAIEGALVEATLVHNKAYSSSATMLTQKDGTFTIEGLAEGSYVVRAAKEEYSDEVKKEVKSATYDLQIIMKLKGGVSGYVRDKKTARPVKDFQIRALLVRHGRMAQSTKIVESFKTDDGFFEMKNLEPGQYIFSARAPNYADCQSDEVAVVRETIVDNVEIYMDEGGDLKGRVIDRKGQPIVGVTVTLNENNYQDSPLFEVFNAMGDLSGREKEKRAITGKDGSFYLSLIVPKTYQVAFSHDDYSDQAINDIAIYRGKGLTPVLNDVVLTQGASISGTVLDGQGNIIPGATVSITSATNFMKQISADKQGKYSISHLNPGEYVLTIQMINQNHGRDLGNIFKKLMIADQSKVTVELQEGVDQKVDIQLVE